MLHLCKLTGVDNAPPPNSKQFLKDLLLVLSTEFLNTVPCQVIHSEEIKNEFNFLQAVGLPRRGLSEGPIDVTVQTHGLSEISPTSRAALRISPTSRAASRHWRTGTCTASPGEWRRSFDTALKGRTCSTVLLTLVNRLIFCLKKSDTNQPVTWQGIPKCTKNSTTGRLNICLV